MEQPDKDMTEAAEFQHQVTTETASGSGGLGELQELIDKAHAKISSKIVELSHAPGQSGGEPRTLESSHGWLDHPWLTRGRPDKESGIPGQDGPNRHGYDQAQNIMLLREQLQGKENELQATRAELQEAQWKETKLRSLIINEATADRVIDGEVIAIFSAIRQKAQVIASKLMYDLKRISQVSSIRDGKDMAEFYDIEEWKKLTVKDHKDRAMSKIFDMLQALVLDCQSFGLQNHALGEDGKSINTELGRLERLLEAHKVEDSLIADWRIKTLECIDRLGIPSETAGCAAERMMAFLQPLGLTKELEKQIHEMCAEAFKLVMMMRKSKEGYKSETPPTNERLYPESQIDRLVEPLRVKGGGKNSEGSNTVAYVVFGALTKRPVSEDGGQVVLEKAQGVMRRKKRFAPRK